MTPLLVTGILSRSRLLIFLQEEPSFPLVDVPDAEVCVGFFFIWLNEYEIDGLLKAGRRRNKGEEETEIDESRLRSPSPG